MKKTIAYWADTDLVFVNECQKLASSSGKFNYKFIRISHHHDWFTNKRSYVRNFLWLSRIFIKIIINSIGGDLVIFGTNACRILFFFSGLFNNVLYVYNEIPSGLGSIFYLDALIMKSVDYIFVSSEKRRDYVKKFYNRNKYIGVLDNTAISSWGVVNNTSNDVSFIYAGAISGRRFPNEIVDFFLCNGIKIDVFGKVVDIGFKLNTEVFNFCGSVSHSEMLVLMRGYKFGVLSYYVNEVNYDLCAPIKIYEYVEAGCRVVSVNMNKGIIDFIEKYPAVVCHFSKINEMIKFSEDEFKLQRERLLAESYISNVNFAHMFFNLS